MKDTVFVYAPGFVDRLRTPSGSAERPGEAGTSDHGTTYFCPFSAQIIGFLTYYPQVRATLDVVELDFDKPRQQLVDLLGEAHQSAPMLVLGEAPVAIPRVTVEEANGHPYVEKTIEILRYLAATRGVPPPH